MVEQRRILIQVLGNKKMGLGHVYNILTILPYFKNDEILIVMKKNSLGNSKFKNKSYKVKIFENELQLFSIIKKFSPNIIFNDILNTKASFIRKLQKMNCFVVNFEDLGTGSNYADLVFNSIYFQKSTSTKFFGEKYACVRKEFRKKLVKSKKKSIAITFGGVDPRKLTLRLLKILEKHQPKYQIFVIIGHEFLHKKQVLAKIKKLKQNGLNINKVEKSDAISKFIDSSMFVITANGRTVFEVAARYVPIITISANPREESHEFPKKKKIGYHLGLHSKVTDQKIIDAIKKMEINNNRKIFENKLKEIDLKNSSHNVEKIINEHYQTWSK
jgi:spore coat polysaccharide biosynthesis predicted glycosyltransferase SpsG